MLCGDFKVRLRLWPTSFAEAEWMQKLPNDYAAYLDFYKLAATKDQGGMAKARAGWIILDQERVWTQAFQPLHADKKAQGTLVHLHGYYDHGASYPALQRWALKNNLCYVTTDLPGHGLSSGKRASVNSFADYQKMLSSLVEVLEADRFPRPWLVSGFSTGAAIALEYQLTAGCFDHTLLLAPLVRPVGWREKLVPWLWLPRLLIRKLPRKFQANSSDTAFLKFVREQDCLQSSYLSLTWVTALGNWIKQIEQSKPCDINALIVQGDADATVDWQYNLKVLYRLLPQAVSIIIDGGGHQLLNEAVKQKTQVFECLDSWLLKIKGKKNNE